MDTKALRQKILDLAIHGRLVAQDPADEPASALLRRINPKAEITSENAPFEVPSNWAWCKLGEICTIKGGKRIPKGFSFSKEKTEHVYLRVTDMKSNTIVLDDLRYISNEVYDQIKNYTINSSDLYLTIAGTIGSVGIIPQEVDGMNLTENAAKLTNIACEKKYLLYALQSTIVQDHFTSRFHQVAQPKLSIETASSAFIPLPPLSEQRRIVAEIERWFSLIDIIESGKASLQTAVKQAKTKILDLAIHGRLMAQDPADEPASALLRRINPKAEITSENAPFEVPSGWCLCHFSSLFEITMGQSPDGHSINHKHGIEFHQGKILFGNKYIRQSDTFTEAPTKIAKANSILLCVRAPVGVINITQREICIGRGLCSLKPYPAIDLDFAYYALTTFQQVFESKSTGSTFKAISGSIIRNESFVLPPLAEQRRIVAEIEEIFTRLDIIEAEL